MKGRPVDQLVYEFMFPKPRATDVPNFQSFLHRHLIHEVRQEVHSFYGHLNDVEAKYPGLDYCHPIHRIRLSRWMWHRRLFRAFDALRLTNAEIAGLTKWEGTKWAKERYEHDTGTVIEDSAFNEIPPYVEPEDRPQATGENPTTTSRESREDEEEDDVDDEDLEAEEDSDGEPESIGFALNQGLRERAASGQLSLHYEEEWEQWLKNAIDSGEFPFLTDPSQQPSDLTLIAQALFPPNMLNAARAGHWEGIPDWLREIIRRTLDIERTRNAETERARNAETSSSTIQSQRSGTTMDSLMDIWSSMRGPYSELRLPPSGGNRGNSSGDRLHSTAQPGA